MKIRMHPFRKYLLFLLVFTASACSDKPSDRPDAVIAKKNKPEYPHILQKALDAHGSSAHWQTFYSLEYDLTTTLGKEKKEHQLIDLKSRKVRISGSSYTIGFDGEDVWVTPDKVAFAQMPPRFYHNLVFYFFAMPFVLADPGINYEDLGEREIEGKRYLALKVSFQKGVGDADGDLYIAHFNPETFQLEVLLYTVTYFSGEKHENYNVLVYNEWQQVNGLTVPKVMTGHKYEADSIREVRYRAEFSNVDLSDKQADASLFLRPAGAEIDSLKKQ
ncbi:DUF6503 family protein [Fulvivirga imtechensis]|nr:DUF6503 family protein [Fulvivirga imtechensis]